MSTVNSESKAAHKAEEQQQETCLSSSQQPSSTQEEHVQEPVSAQPVPKSNSNGALAAAAPVEHKIKKPVEALAHATVEKSKNKSPVKATSRGMVDEILDSLAEVESLMNRFREYIKVHKGKDKPLYQWATYPGYSRLQSAVKELDKATAKFKRARLPQEYVSASVARATESSTSVSKAASYALAVMNEKTETYLEEMETSTLSDDAKIHANAVITRELQKLMEHSTHATERVWAATDLLRTLKKQGSCKDWAWSAAGTVMTAGIAAVVGIVTAHLYGPAGFGLLPAGGQGEDMYRQVIDLVQRTQAVTNITSELYTIKLQDIDDRYKNLAALSESHGERIDSIVDGLGPPNEEGLYYVSAPKAANSESSEHIHSHITKVSYDAARQMQRLQDEMQLMRKNINRMDIRLSNGLDKCRKE